MSTASTRGQRAPIWERPERGLREQPVELTRAAIVAAAVRVADASGLDAVSIRKVGAALGAGPMRLYGHLDGKDELLELMIDEVYGEIADDAAAVGEGRGTLAYAEATRRAALRHEWLTDLLGGRPHLGPHALAVLDATATVLAAECGLTDVDDLAQGLAAVNAYVVGALRREVAERRANRADGLDEPGWQAAHGAYLGRQLATGTLPTLARLVTEGSPTDPEITYARGLRLLLAGLRSSD